MKYLVLFVSLLLNAGCSNISDILRTSTMVLSTRHVNPAVVNTAIIHSNNPGAGAAAGSSTNTGAGMVVTTGAALMSIQSPAVAENGAVVPITIVGLNLLSGESARIYADNCEVMEITNHGDTTIRTLSTRVKMNKSTSAKGFIRVEAAGRQASSEPIEVTNGSGACNQDLGLHAANDIDFSHYAEKANTDKQSIRLNGSFEQGVTNVKAVITHPMETGQRAGKQSGNNVPAHYITNISIMQNQQEVATIKSTPSLSKNPHIAMELETLSDSGEFTLLWRDNTDKVGKNTTKI